MRGYLVLGGLTLLSVVAALGLAVRARCRGRAELLLATTIIWNLLLVGPIYALGLTDRLNRRTLGALSLGSFLFFIGVAMMGKTPRAFVEELVAAARSLIAMPGEAMAQAVRRRSVITVGLLITLLLIVWSAVMSWYVPSWGSWDALWYHEPMIGYAIQNQGFAFVDLPPDLQKVNGFPRLVEMTQLWFVIFTDRRLIEVLNSLLSPALVAVVYALCARYTRDRLHAVGWAVSLFLLPFVSGLLQTVFVDLASGLYVLGAIYFVTKDELRLEDAALTIGCLVLAVGSKVLTYVPVFLVGSFALARLVQAHARKKPLHTTALVVAGLLAVGGMAATTLWRNYRAFHNPLWPDFELHSDRWNIHWSGSTTWATGGEPGVLGLPSMNVPHADLVARLLAPPYAQTDGSLQQAYDYGFALGWIIVPCWIAALLAISVGVVLESLARHLGGSFELRRESRALLLVNVPALAMLYTSPALWSARYNVAIVGVMMATLAWLGGRARWGRVAEVLVSISVVASLLTFFWSPRWVYKPYELWALASIPYPQREVTQQWNISHELPLMRGSPIDRDVGLARARELREGDTLVYGDLYGGYPALFWNDEFSNRVVYVPQERLIEGAREHGATWVYCYLADANLYRLRARPWEFEEIGLLNVEGWGLVFRRVAR